jgi:hypothetical protein
MNTTLTEKLRNAAVSTETDPVVNELFEAVVATLINQGVSDLMALRAAERAVAFLIKEGA